MVNNSEIIKSKLLVSIATLASGGAERVISVLSKSFADNFDEVVYVLWLKRPFFYQLDQRVRVICMPDISCKSDRYHQIPVFRRIVKQESPDVVLSFLTPFNMLALVATIGLHVPVVVSERCDPDVDNLFWQNIRNMVYLRAAGILTQTYAAQKCFRGRLASKTDVIYNPITMPAEMVGSALKTPKDDLFVTAGRLMPIKNQRMMIDAMAMLHKKYPSYKLIIYGEGPERESLETYIHSKSLDETVFLPGNEKDIWKAMLPAKAFLLTSDHEGMPNAMLEAMCLGLPCITTRLKASLELMENGRNGLLVDFNDSTALFHEMVKLIEDDSLSHSIGNAGTEVFKTVNSEVIESKWIQYLKGYGRK